MEQVYTNLLTNDNNVSSILRQLDKYKYNPSGIQRVILSHLKEITEGTIDIVDPTNPFVFLLEASAVNTANFIIQNEVNTRKQYPATAQTHEDIYIHMSDTDYIDRFATPAQTKFSILIKKDELLEKFSDGSLKVPGTNFSKLTIPGNTEFKVADTVFSLQYPVDIKRFDHAGFQIIYDTTKESPLYTLSTNNVDWEFRTSTQTREEWLYLEVDVHQFKIDSTISAVSVANGFSETYSFDNQFYYARVYNKSNNTSNQWLELKTTHTDQVYDIYTPTVVLKVVDKLLTVSIPQIYLNTGQISGSIRVDIYDTKGKINMILENYLPSTFEADWRVLDSNDADKYNSAINSIRTVFTYSNKTVIGGKDSISFKDLRSKVINNAIGNHDLPITNVQIESALSNKGYSVIKNIDVVTNRVFLATRSMPDPIDDRIITNGNASIETFILNMSGDDNIKFLRNGGRLTLTPDIIYLNNNEVITITDTKFDAAISKVYPTKREEDENKAKILNSAKYLYSPFFYVLDASVDEFEVRPYRLDKPIVKSTTFKAQNQTSLIDIATDRYKIELSRVMNGGTNTGYKLSVATKSNDNAKKLDISLINAQLSFIPKNETNRVYLNSLSAVAGPGIVGSPYRNDDNEIVFEFLIKTRLDIDEDDTLYLYNFKLTNNMVTVGTDLTTEFDMTYSVCLPVNSSLAPDTSDIDNIINRAILPDNTIGITHEKLKVEFGTALKTLWCRSRSVASAEPYKIHNFPKFKFHEEDVYEIDPVTGSIFTIDRGQIKYKLLYPKGSHVTDSNGAYVYEHKVGDIMKDSYGNPIPEDYSRVLRQIDMLFLDATYYYADDEATVNYRNLMIDSIVNWLTVDIADMSNRLLEQTRIYFYPKTNIGNINVLVDNGLVTGIDASQKLTVKLYVSSLVFSNDILRKSLTRATIKALDILLKQSVISISNILVELKNLYGNDVINIDITGLGGEENNFSTISILNEGDTCSIKKKLAALSNNTLSVEEDINIIFFKHEMEVV